MYRILDFIKEIAVQAGWALIAFQAIFSLLNCFFGYKLQKVWIAIIGFLIGFFIGFICSVSLFKFNAGIGALMGVLLGLVLALAAFKVYKAGVFLFCGITIYGMLYQLIPIQWLGIVLGVICGIGAGVLALKFLRPAIIFTTAVGSGISAAQQLLSLFKVTNLPVVLCAGMILAAAGVIVQLKTTSRDSE